MTSPIVVAGLADTINNAVAGMARAKAAADALNTSATRLVGNLTAIESVQAQLDDANSQVEKAIEAVGGPLPDSNENGGGASSAGITPHNPPAAAAQQGTSAQHVAPATEVAAAQVEAANAAGNAPK